MISQRPERLLAHLQGMPFLAGYSFSIYKPGLTEATDDINRALCSAQNMSHICRGLCVPFLTAVSEESLAGGKAAPFRCPRSRFIFSIPFSAESCLVCGGALSIDSETNAQEIILVIKRLIASFMSEEKTQPLDSVQPPIAPRSHQHRQQHRQQHIRRCRR